MFENLDMMWKETLDEICMKGRSQGSRDGATTEIIGFTAELKYPWNNVIINPTRKFSLSYACAEFLWYLSGRQDILMIKEYAPQYEKFTEHNIAYGAYGDRWRRSNQVSKTECLFKHDPETRQAIMSMWMGRDLQAAIDKIHKDLPCTLSLQFLQRQGQLNCITTMRSNDVWLGFPYDVFAFTSLQIMFSLALQFNVGYYYHRAGSEHLYIRNLDTALTVWEEAYEPPRSEEECPYGQPILNLEREIEDAVETEERCRHYNWTVEEADQISMNPFFKDLILGTLTKRMPVPKHYFTHPLFKEFGE